MSFSRKQLCNMRSITFILIGFISCIGYGQESNLLKGRIVIDTLKLEAIHIVNKTQEIGVINDTSGFFQIKANPGDIISFSSVQYEVKEHIVTQKDLDSDDFRISLRLSVNQLDEVFVSQHSLTGKIEKDLQKIPTYTENLPFWNAAELKQMGVGTFNDAQSSVKNTVLPDEMDLTPMNLLGIVDLVGKAFKGKRKYIETNFEIADFYKEEFVIEALEIPETSYYDFVDFVNEQPYTVVVLQSNDKLKVLEYLIAKSITFKEKYNIEK